MVSDEKDYMPVKSDCMIGLKDSDKRKSACLTDDELAIYTERALSGNLPAEHMLHHLIECDRCFSKVASAVAALKSFEKDASSEVDRKAKEKAKAIPNRYNKARSGSMKRNLSIFIAAGFFILSFISSRYFMQFLAASVVFGFKWVMDTGGSRALIMIYDAWQQKKKSGSESNKEPLNRRRV